PKCMREFAQYLAPKQAEYVTAKVHEGVCGTRIGERALASNVLRAEAGKISDCGNGLLHQMDRGGASGHHHAQVWRISARNGGYNLVSHWWNILKQMTKLSQPVREQGLKKRLEAAKGLWVDELPMHNVRILCAQMGENANNLLASLNLQKEVRAQDHLKEETSKIRAAWREVAPMMGRTAKSQRGHGERSLPFGALGWEEGTTNLESSKPLLLLQLENEG
ncbi:hypothetical protein A2U01_0004505, partial [Trifolium medium]|nr:hypothetical protein [Trifolium medium]